MPVLYTFSRSSASFRLRIAAGLKNISYDSKVVDLPTGQQATPDFMALNPQGLVPAWVDDSGVFAQSMAIMEYWDETYPGPKLLPSDPWGRAQVRNLSQLIACEIHPLNNLRVLKYLKRELNQTDEGVNVWYRYWIAQGLASLERQLNTNAKLAVERQESPAIYAWGNQPTMADCCLVPQIFNAKRYECDLAPYPTTMKVFEACMKLPAFDLAQPSKQLG